MGPIDILEPEIAERIAALQREPRRDPARAAQGRQAFLQAAQEMAVSAPKIRRHMWWMVPIRKIYQIKERSPMLASMVSVIFIASLVFGGAGAGMAAAQSSLPEQPLYTLKLWSEQARLALNADPQEEWQLALEFANRRAEEIRSMVQSGQEPDEAVQARFQEQIEQTIRLAAGMPGDQALIALEQVRQRLQTQEQAMRWAQNGAGPQAAASLLRAQEMLRERLFWVEAGLKNPQQLLLQMRYGQPMATPGAGSGNPWTSGTPTPDSGYGPGPGTCASCTPTGTSQGPGPHASGTPTPGSNTSSNPWTTGTPTPGSSYGPGPGTCANCTPTYTPGSGPGSQPTEKPGGQPQPTQGGQGDPTGTPQGGQQGTPASTPQATPHQGGGGK